MNTIPIISPAPKKRNNPVKATEECTLIGDEVSIPNRVYLERVQEVAPGALVCAGGIQAAQIVSPFEGE